mgnify:CR=1 FL=1
MMNLGNALWLSGFLVEVTLIAFLLFRRGWAKFPAFFSLICWDSFSNIINFYLLSHAKDAYLTAYLIEVSISSVLEFCVLVELAWSVLKPIKGSLSRWALLYIAGMILLAGALIWPFSGLEADAKSQEILLVHVVQTVGFLRVGFFLLLAATSQWLSIGWRDRELQIATGLGFYSLVSLIIAMIRAHQPSIDQYSTLNSIVVAGYLCSTSYWVISFAQKEAARREFTPQMQNMLLAVAGAARANRAALSDSHMSHSDNRREP